MVYPKYPDTFWSFRHALRFISKKAAVPPLGLITVSAMLPTTWQKKLVDMNVSALQTSDIVWADYVFISAMYIQKESVSKIIEECKKVKVKIKEGKCPCCRVCEVKCPEGTIHVRRIFTGKLRIHKEKCPEGCQDCLDVCPITGALFQSKKDGKINVNESACVYCGLCKVICPEEGVFSVRRTP